MQASVRSGELLARHDDDELAMVLPRTLLAEAVARAGQLREEIEHARFCFQGEAIPITVSIGVAVLSGHSDTRASLVRAATDRLSDAKRGGRNRVTHRPDHPR